MSDMTAALQAFQEPLSDEVWTDWVGDIPSDIPSEDAWTDLIPEVKKGVKGGKASNTEFLAAVHHRQVEGARPGIVSFPGNPANMPSRVWKVLPAGAELPDEANNYFTLASYYNDPSGNFKRTKKTFAALAAIMLDDVGTKIDGTRIALAPSWRLETSPGNYQLGYILREPLVDAPTADRLMSAVIAAGLCDPGAGGPTARLARLPGGYNGKAEPPFTCRLVEWEPQRLFSMDELVSGFGLELPEAGRPQRRRPDGATVSGPGDDVYLPSPGTNPVINALHVEGLYKNPLGNGKHDITCPWVSEHTGDLDTGTAYFEPDDGFPLGGFKCLHSHGDRLHIRDLLDALRIPHRDAKMKPTVRVLAGNIHRIVDHAEQLLSTSGIYYQAARRVSVVNTDPTSHETLIQELKPPALVRALSRVALWERYDARTEDWVTCDPPARHCSVLYDAADYPHLPVLRGIARQPHLRDDGSLVAKADYDALTGRFGVFDPRSFPVPLAPSRAEAQQALGILEDLLCEVAFSDAEIDKAAAVSAMLAAAARPALPTCPGYLSCAHTISSGKSFLIKLIAILASAAKPPGLAFPTEAEEMRKLLITQLRTSPAIINFDDLSGDIVPSPTLKTCLTDEYVGDRLLGGNDSVMLPTRTMFLFSGNNVEPVRDMSRRIITIRLDPRMEHPTQRQFQRPHAEDDARRDRARYVTAALTLIRAWMVAGSPMTTVKPLASYNRWSDWCRQPLLWLGRADPATRLFEQLTLDPDRELLGRMLYEWHAAHGDKPMKIREVVGGYHCSEFKETLGEAAADKSGLIDRSRLGWWLRKHAGRQVDGLRFERDDTVHPCAWRVVGVPTALPEDDDDMDPF